MAGVPLLTPGCSTVWEIQGKGEPAAICLATSNALPELVLSLTVLVVPSQSFSSAYSIQSFQTDLERQNPASSCMGMDREGK